MADWNVPNYNDDGRPSPDEWALYGEFIQAVHTMTQSIVTRAHAQVRRLLAPPAPIMGGAGRCEWGRALRSCGLNLHAWSECLETLRMACARDEGLAPFGLQWSYMHEMLHDESEH